MDSQTEEYLNELFKEKLEFEDRTIKNNIRMINDIIKNVKSDNYKGLDIIKDYDKVEKYYKSLEERRKSGSIYNYVNNINNIIKFSTEMDISKETKTKYKELAIYYKRLKNDVYNDNEIDNNKYIPYKRMVKLPFTFWEGNKFYNIEEFKRLDNTKKKKYLVKFIKYLILFIYTQRPPLRLEYWNVKVYIRDEINDINEKIKKKENFIIWDKEHKYMTLYLNKFKNSKTFGEQKFRLEDNIYKLLIYWFDFVKEINGKVEYLLYNVQNNLTLTPFKDERYLGAKISDIILKLTTRWLTATDLRKIYETHTINHKDYNKKTNRQQQALHKKLLHSKATVHNQYNKVE
jgi:hypothetical protein